MKQHRTKRKGRLAILLAAVLSFSVLFTGCVDELLYLLEDEGDVWADADVDAWEETRGENWWDHPGQGGTTAGDDWDYEGDLEWWNVLDESWGPEDWEYMEDGVWMIFDEETNCVYLYDEEYEQFGAMDVETEETYILDMETGEWLPAE